jgi:5,10-methylenetetrahydromethanopterin reductase
VAEAVRGYVEVAKRFEPADARYLENHTGHLMAVKESERRFVTGELIRATTFTGTEAQLADRIANMRDAGYTEFTIQVVPGQEHAIADWARIMKRLGIG